MCEVSKTNWCGGSLPNDVLYGNNRSARPLRLFLSVLVRDQMKERSSSQKTMAGHVAAVMASLVRVRTAHGRSSPSWSVGRAEGQPFVRNSCPGHQRQNAARLTKDERLRRRQLQQHRLFRHGPGACPASQPVSQTEKEKNEGKKERKREKKRKRKENQTPFFIFILFSLLLAGAEPRPRARARHAAALRHDRPMPSHHHHPTSVREGERER